MKYYIPITEDTLPLITELNNGITPKIETEHTVFIVEPGEVPEINLAASLPRHLWYGPGSVPLYFSSE